MLWGVQDDSTRAQICKGAKSAGYPHAIPLCYLGLFYYLSKGPREVRFPQQKGVISTSETLSRNVTIVTSEKTNSVGKSLPLVRETEKVWITKTCGSRFGSLERRTLKARPQDFRSQDHETNRSPLTPEQQISDTSEHSPRDPQKVP